MKRVIGFSIVWLSISAAQAAEQAVTLCPDATAERTFTHTFTGDPLDVLPHPDEEVTEAVKRFHCTWENPYRDDATAVAAGASLFREYCAICHGVDAKGRMGPSLLAKQWLYEKNTTDKGVFETVWGGAAAAMAPLRGRLSQDDILKVMAYLMQLRAR